MTFNWRSHFSGDGFGADYNVAAVQTRLNALGINPQLRVDGSMGPLTVAAIMAFQRANALRSDGVIGPQTAAALGLSVDSVITAQPASSGGKVSVPAFPGFARLSQSDQRAFVKAAQWIAPGETDAAKWLAAIVDFESAKSWSPSKRNPGPSGATGLIQFIGPTARSLGTTLNGLAAMSFSQQLEYVKRYFSEISRTQGKIHSLADMYLSVFSPKGVGKSLDTVLYSSGEPGYDQNTGLDFGSKGFITVRDVASAPQSRLSSVASLAPILVSVGTSVVGIAVVGGMVAAWFLRKQLFGL